MNWLGSRPTVAAAKPSVSANPPGIQTNGQNIAQAKAKGVRRFTLRVTMSFDCIMLNPMMIRRRLLRAKRGATVINEPLQATCTPGYDLYAVPNPAHRGHFRFAGVRVTAQA